MAQTLPNGAVIPDEDGKELIPGNGVEPTRVLGSSLDVQLGMKASITYVDQQMTAAMFTKNNPGPFDFDQMKTPGVYSLGSPFPEGWTNVPDSIEDPSIFNVYGSPVQSWCVQEIFQFGSNPIRKWRISRTTEAWNPWIEVGGANGVGSAMASNAAWQTNFVSKTGGVVNTGGKPAFALRLDHGYTNIKALLRDELLARGIVPGIATNSRLWDIDENNGATPAEVNQWVADGEVEILNHSATHAGGMDESGLVDEIVTGRLELEEQLPAAAPIWGFAPPGVTQGWDGFNSGKIDGWTSPSAQIILASHAYSLGYVGGALRVLDGTIRQALSHITLDTYDMSQARAQVDAAIREGRGIQVMLHPRELDKSGKLSTADFLSFLDYVVAKRDAGDLVTLSPGELVRADASRSPVQVDDVAGLDERLTVLEQDTGDLDITPSVPEVTQGRWTARRVGSWVYMNLYDLGLTPTSGTFWQRSGFLPVGFRPPAASQYVHFPTAQRTDGFTPGPFRVDRYGGVTIFGVTDKLVAVTASWVTNDPFPDPVPWEPTRALWDPRADINGAAADSLDFLDDQTDQEAQP